jgi:fructose-1,6-bisphosphatase I
MAGIDSNPLTLSRFLLTPSSNQTAAKDPGFTLLMSSIQLACKTISQAVRKAGISGLYGLDGSVNETGDEVKKLDVLSNDIFKNACKFSQELCVLVSEEEPNALIITESAQGKYCIATDPLDGSSNIDCNVSTGTIFGIYQRPSRATASEASILRPGRELICAGYCMYGSSTQLVFTAGNGVHGFTLDPAIGEFILTHRDIKIPEKPKTIYSINEGNSIYWHEPVRRFVEQVKNAQPKPYSARYVGSMVSDVHRTLLYGGIFMYPADKKSKNGKLRILYEGNPMSMICEQAGGLATTGRQRVLDVVPTSIHERTPIFLGCKRDVEQIIRIHQQVDAEQTVCSIATC